MVQLKATDVKCACPFCGNNELSVSLIPVDKSRRNSTGSVSTKDRSSSVSESDRSSGSSQSQQVNLSYTTPEQEKKLRSLSVDNTSNVSSRNDRETLERQIREQRLQFDERDLAEAQRSGVRGRGGYHNSAGAAAGSPFLRHARLGRYGLPEEATSPGGRTGSGAGLLRSPGSSSRAGAAGSTIDNATNSFVSSIENLLQSQSSGGATRITSIQQLEDIMLMEVRLYIVYVSG